MAKAVRAKRKATNESTANVGFEAKLWADGDVIDVFTAAGIKKPDISILSDEFDKLNELHWDFVLSSLVKPDPIRPESGWIRLRTLIIILRRCFDVSSQLHWFSYRI